MGDGRLTEEGERLFRGADVRSAIASSMSKLLDAYSRRTGVLWGEGPAPRAPHACSASSAVRATR